MNNAVYRNWECIGFRCFTCGLLFQSMWDCTCNSCRAKEKQHKEQIEAIKELTKALTSRIN